MGLPVLEKGCCGCCSIPTCVKIQAVLSMIGAVMGVIKTIEGCVSEPNDVEEARDGHKMSCAMGLIVYLLKAVLCGLLVHGVFKSNHRFIKPYLYAEVGVMGLFVLMILICLAFALVLPAILLVLLLLLDFYCWLHVYSLYVSQQQEAQGINNPEHPNYAGGQEPTYQGYQSPTSGYVPQAPANDQVP